MSDTLSWDYSFYINDGAPDGFNAAPTPLDSMSLTFTTSDVALGYGPPSVPFGDPTLPNAPIYQIDGVSGTGTYQGESIVSVSLGVDANNIYGVNNYLFGGGASTGIDYDGLDLVVVTTDGSTDTTYNINLYNGDASGFLSAGLQVYEADGVVSGTWGTSAPSGTGTGAAQTPGSSQTLTTGSFTTMDISGTNVGVTLDGATLTTSTVEDGGALMVESGAASDITVAAGGFLAIDGGSVDGASVQDGGSEYVTGGLSTGNIIEDGAIQSISAGATAEDDSVSTDATVTFSAGGTLILGNQAWVDGDHAVLVDEGGGIGMVEVLDAAGQVLQSFQTVEYAGEQFNAVDDNGSVELIAEPVCYLAGTRILTVAGEVAVEDLRAGDLLVTRFGPLRAVKWIGRQSFAGVFLGQARAPVCIKAGAFGENVPRRDLYVSSGHRMVIDDVLVRAECLVNGVTITQTATNDMVEYYHIDFGVHDCVIAEGAWSESYAAEGNRATFHNAAEFGDQEDEQVALCLKLVDWTDAQFAAIQMKLLGNVAGAVVTEDAGLHLVADGVRIEAEANEGRNSVFRVPAGTRSLRVRSHASRPVMLGINGDERMLGVRLYGVTADHGDVVSRLAVESDGLREGWSWLESTEDGGAFRWTDGDAALPAALIGGGAGSVIVTLRWGGLARYFVAPAAESRCGSAGTRLLLVA